jgi:DNA-binding XRE family transcriptional regulator
LTKHIDKHLGQRIAQARQEASAESAWLAREIETSTQTLSEFETGERRIPALYVARCAKALKKPLKWFFGGLPGQDVFETADNPVRVRLVK